MTKKEIDQIAEAIFKKLIVMQNELDQQQYNIIDHDFIVARIVELNVYKFDAVQNEEYEKASEIQKEITNLREQLNKIRNKLG